MSLNITLPVRMSLEMSIFTGLSRYNLYSYPIIMAFILSYIKENNLQSENRRQINPDDDLRSLLPSDFDYSIPLTYMRFGQYMHSHFVNDTLEVQAA